MEARVCLYCNSNFAPNKYSPRQRVCSNSECQKTRQLESMKEWRKSHPDYFKFDETKGQEWLDAQRQRSRQWRQKNPEKIKVYRATHLDQYRSYMRDYMRRYRERKKDDTSSPDISDTRGSQGSMPGPSQN